MFFRNGGDDPFASAADVDVSAHVAITAQMTTSEQLFFLGAPLAHVVRYEEELREERFRRAANFRHSHSLAIAS